MQSLHKTVVIPVFRSKQVQGMLEGGGGERSQLQIIIDRQNSLWQNILQRVLTQSCTTSSAGALLMARNSLFPLSLALHSPVLTGAHLLRF